MEIVSIRQCRNSTTGKVCQARCRIPIKPAVIAAQTGNVDQEAALDARGNRKVGIQNQKGAFRLVLCLGRRGPPRRARQRQVWPKSRKYTALPDFVIALHAAPLRELQVMIPAAATVQMQGLLCHIPGTPTASRCRVEVTRSQYGPERTLSAPARKQGWLPLQALTWSPQHPDRRRPMHISRECLPWPAATWLFAGAHPTASSLRRNSRPVPSRWRWSDIP